MISRQITSIADKSPFKEVHHMILKAPYNCQQMMITKILGKFTCQGNILLHDGKNVRYYISNLNNLYLPGCQNVIETVTRMERGWKGSGKVFKLFWWKKAVCMIQKHDPIERCSTKNCSAPSKDAKNNVTEHPKECWETSAWHRTFKRCEIFETLCCSITVFCECSNSDTGHQNKCFGQKGCCQLFIDSYLGYDLNNSAKYSLLPSKYRSSWTCIGWERFLVKLDWLCGIVLLLNDSPLRNKLPTQFSCDIFQLHYIIYQINITYIQRIQFMQNKTIY